MAESQDVPGLESQTSATSSSGSSSLTKSPDDDLSKVERHAPEREQLNSPSNESSQSSPPQDVVELCRETFQKTAEYLRGELDGTVEDYKLLEKMNTVTTSRYSEMKHIALSISGALKSLNEKYKSLQPYLEQIDQIEESVATLEQAAYSLDQYSKRLESKFKALERR
ncbi:biogenesis of lysosome-related organelles complex 1 subunit 2-like [Plakobranchus ocellatus]|uniref:Biogenesis of lysosome-related organelles complex 1 subunit 2-like n=1 Tax=Plakobranchus ocellatus TaxID=259542 RepID=A0AAV4D1S2_9GAST|nr:biogenesis of lysosome-related organelles complex 1 subunit 2-like [Plakobranchus ocellatus]